MRRVQPFRFEMALNDLARFLRRHLRVAHGHLSGDGDLHQRRAVAHAHAADRFHHRDRARFARRLFQRRAHFLAAARHAAGADADTNLRQPLRAPGAMRPLPRHQPALFQFQKIAQGVRHAIRRQMAVGDPVNLQRRRQRTAAQAGDLLHGEYALRVGIRLPADRQCRQMASCTNSEPFTWQAVPWQTLIK